MRHELIVYGKQKGHGRLRKHVPEYIGPIPLRAAENVKRWFIVEWKGLERAPAALKSLD